MHSCYILSCLTSFTQYNDFYFYPCCWMHQQFIPFSWLVFCCINLLIHSSMMDIWVVSSFMIVNKAAVYILQTCFHLFGSKPLALGLLSYMVQYLTFKKLPNRVKGGKYSSGFPRRVHQLFIITLKYHKLSSLI